MHATLASGLDALGIRNDLPSLEEAARVSEENLAAARDWLHEAVPPREDDNVDVVVLGSYARQEASGESDFDYLVIAHGLTPLTRLRRPNTPAARPHVPDLGVCPAEAQNTLIM